jgi:hypothetical protein
MKSTCLRASLRAEAECRAGGEGYSQLTMHDNIKYGNFIGGNFVVAGSIYNGLAGWADEQPPLCSIELPHRATALYSMGWSMEVGLRPVNAARPCSR